MRVPCIVGSRAASANVLMRNCASAAAPASDAPSRSRISPFNRSSSGRYQSSSYPQRSLAFCFLLFLLLRHGRPPHRPVKSAGMDCGLSHAVQQLKAIRASRSMLMQGCCSLPCAPSTVRRRRAADRFLFSRRPCALSWIQRLNCRTDGSICLAPAGVAETWCVNKECTCLISSSLIVWPMPG